MIAALRWAAEIAGVIVIATAAALWWLPLGVGVVGVYLIIVAQIGEEQGR